MKNTAVYSVAWLGFLMAIAACSSEPAQQTASSTQDTISGEQYRPVYHFTPPGHWMNDPNGMVYYDGEYHLFYQHYPDSNVWGPMHWGHAISEDLVHWEHLPIALYPDSLGYIFSGSAVVDKQNTSGLGTTDNPPLIAMFTYHDPQGEREGRNDYQYQAIAYSTDRGRSWTKYEGNPVVENPGIKDFRDPNMFWHEPSQQWVLIFAAADRVRFYNSPNLIDWTFTSEFGENSGSHGGVWECPDIFKLTVDGEEKWVMLLSINPGGPNGGSATQYFVGDFDGKAFTNDNPEETSLWLDYGKDNYAGVSWSDVPEEDGRRIFIGWMSNWQYANVVPTYAWRSAMTVPRTLELVSTEEGVRLASRPVKELETLRESSASVEAGTLEESRDLTELLDAPSATIELEVSFDLTGATASEMGVVLANTLGEEVRIGYNLADQEYYVDRSKAGKTDFSDEFPGRHLAPRIASGNTLTMHLLVDVASVELFADDGKTVMTEIFFPNEPLNQVSLFADGGSVQIQEGEIYNLTDNSVMSGL
uniref:Glycoside hydrolase family 32 protein n=1 Tax=Roseihalotalea indica TaxID=2867963 RepID=A0AA49GTW4_9BACT|nr:glycoside hydrolase family 32 protein [Tunicatimonas sp. TK19036]